MIWIAASVTYSLLVSGRCSFQACLVHARIARNADVEMRLNTMMALVPFAVRIIIAIICWRRHSHQGLQTLNLHLARVRRLAVEWVWRIRFHNHRSTATALSWTLLAAKDQSPPSDCSMKLVHLLSRVRRWYGSSTVQYEIEAPFVGHPDDPEEYCSWRSRFSRGRHLASTSKLLCTKTSWHKRKIQLQSFGRLLPNRRVRGA